MFPDTLITSAHTLHTHTHTRTRRQPSSSTSTHTLSPCGWSTSAAPRTPDELRAGTAAVRPRTHAAGRAVHSAVTHRQRSCVALTHSRCAATARQQNLSPTDLSDRIKFGAMNHRSDGTAARLQVSEDF